MTLDDFIKDNKGEIIAGKVVMRHTRDNNFAVVDPKHVQGWENLRWEVVELSAKQKSILKPKK